MTVGGVTSTIQIGIFTWYNQSPEAQIYVRYRNIRIISKILWFDLIFGINATFSNISAIS